MGLGSDYLRRTHIVETGLRVVRAANVRHNAGPTARIWPASSPVRPAPHRIALAGQPVFEIAKIPRHDGGDDVDHLFDRFLDEAERIGVFDQRPNFRTVQTGWNFGIDLELQGDLAARKGRELLDDGLNDSMDIPCRSLR